MHYLKALPSALPACLMFANTGLTSISQAGVSVQGNGNVDAQAPHEQIVSETNCIIVKYGKRKARVAAAFNTSVEKISQAIHFSQITRLLLKS
jgi:hypothetical protein